MEIYLYINEFNIYEFLLNQISYLWLLNFKNGEYDKLY